MMSLAKLALALAVSHAHGSGHAGTGSGTDADPCHTTHTDIRHSESKGACYTHGVGVACNVDAASCGGSWYAPGYLYGGCCFCEGGCNVEETGATCSYYEDGTENYPETLVYTATVDPFAGPTGYFKFDECGDVANPVITMKQNTRYVFDQSDNSNWYHPLGWAYFVDGAHEDVDELEPSITQSGNSCAGSNSCQAPMYYKNSVFAGAGTYPASGNDGDFGLDAYEPEFFIRKEDWLATKYSVALTLTDTTYAKDIFYFCHIHGGMSGYIKIADASGTVISTTGTGTDEAIAADYHKTPSTYDASCGTYGLEDYTTGGAKQCMAEDFFCGGVGALASGSFGECLHSMDCAMDYNMKTTLDSDDTASFMHQMIPHHNNAINMAKLLMKKETTLTADGEIMDILWSIVNNQGMQVQFMEGWLDGESKAASAVCTSTMRRKLATPNLRVAAEAAPARKLTGHAGTGAGTDADPCVTTNCASATECTFTATVDPFAGPTGYFKYAECGNVANPVIVMNRGVTYTFDQSDDSNWYHPLGFAYFVDGAHEDVDELEPGITQTSGACAADNTCQAPMYYKDGAFAGAAGYDNTASPATGGEDFGLDAYEPEFFIRKGDWAEATYTVKLTLTDAMYATDIFYFCHIHGGMSGYIKIADAAGTVVSTRGTGAALIAADYHKTPSAYDALCGGYHLDPYQSSGGMCTDTFLCTTATLASGSFGDCLNAMDCAMDLGMKTSLHSNNIVSFMHQMIPHHENAVNMAKLLMKKGFTDTADGEIDSMLWDIINVQGMQIQAMESYLSSNNYALSSSCAAPSDAAGRTAPALFAAALAAAALLA